MRIRNRYVKDKHFSNVDSFLSPISEAIPDQSLTVKQLFERYNESTLEQLLIREIRQKQQVNDGAKPSFGDYVPLNLTYNELYEKSVALSIKYRDKSLKLPKEEINAESKEEVKESLEVDVKEPKESVS